MYRYRVAAVLFCSFLRSRRSSGRMRDLRPRPPVALGATAGGSDDFADREEPESRVGFFGVSSHSENRDDSVSVAPDDPEQLGDWSGSSGEKGTSGASDVMLQSAHSKAMSASWIRAGFSSILPTEKRWIPLISTSTSINATNATDYLAWEHQAGWMRYLRRHRHRRQRRVDASSLSTCRTWTLDTLETGNSFLLLHFATVSTSVRACHTNARQASHPIRWPIRFTITSINNT